MVEVKIEVEVKVKVEVEVKHSLVMVLCLHSSYSRVERRAGTQQRPETPPQATFLPLPSILKTNSQTSLH
jgi:hypothetical protein